MPCAKEPRAIDEMENTNATGFGEPGRGAATPAGMVCLREAARMFGVDATTVKRWEREGCLPCSMRSGGRRLYPLDQLNKVLAESGRLAPPQPYPDGSGCWRVPLFGKEIRRREAVIDAESLPLVEGRRWCWAADAGREGGHVAMSHDNATTPLRRVIMGVLDPGLHVGHVNGDPLDCRRGNLLVRTVAEQGRGARKMRTWHGRPCSSRFKGVTWAKGLHKWVAQIRVDGKTRNLGRFEDETAAAEAYDAAARELFGEHARLNFPGAAAAAAPADGAPARAA